MRHGASSDKGVAEVIQITPHFTLEEFTYSDTANAQGIDNSPSTEIVVRLTQLALVMEKVRAICNSQPVYVSSGYRCAALNAAVGGVTSSAHQYGCACDFTIPDFGSPLDICLALQPHLSELHIDQLIHEMDTWVHLGLSQPPWNNPRYQCLTINNNGTTTGFV